MSTEDVVAHTLPFCDRFDKKTMEQILTKADNEPILPLLLKLPYFKDINEEQTTDIETAVYTSNRNLTTVIEGVRYSLEPSQIEKMLIL